MSLPQLSAKIAAAFSKLMVSAMAGDMTGDTACDAAARATNKAREEARSMALLDLMRLRTVKAAIGCRLSLTPHGEEAPAVSNHEAPISASSFETPLARLLWMRGQAGIAPWTT